MELREGSLTPLISTELVPLWVEALLADVGVCPGRGQHEGGGEVWGRVGGAGAGPGHRGLLHREAGHLRVLGCDVIATKYA